MVTNIILKARKPCTIPYVIISYKKGMHTRRVAGKEVLQVSIHFRISSLRHFTMYMLVSKISPQSSFGKRCAQCDDSTSPTSLHFYYSTLGFTNYNFCLNLDLLDQPNKNLYYLNHI